MKKKIYEHPQVELIEANSHCMLGNESGVGEGASLEVDFEKESTTQE